jgi:hypothetical protein
MVKMFEYIYQDLGKYYKEEITEQEYNLIKERK